MPAVFVSRLWQIHVFGEGNTRTTAIFFIKYLRQLGFDVDNDLFAEHSWFFRNALVRANYNNLQKGIYETTEYLERFLRNLLQGEKNELHNREMHVSGHFVSKDGDDPINDPINDPIKNTSDEREQRILELLRTDPGLTRAGMAAILGCSDSTVKRALRTMVSKNMLRHIGSNKKGEWIMKSYNFYGWQQADVPAIAGEYRQIRDPRRLYDLLSEIWCADTCAPRMRDAWTKENMTLGQCSITAFLAQDIFGGEVYGICRPDGNYHCYNVVGDCVFDLTSEQFGEEALSYEDNPMQSRAVHFAKEEKRLRYEYLKEELRKKLREG